MWAVTSAQAATQIDDRPTTDRMQADLAQAEVDPQFRRVERTEKGLDLARLDDRRGEAVAGKRGRVQG